MKFTLTSPSGTTLDTDTLVQATLMTETGEITILPDHKPMLSVVRPGVLSVSFEENGEKKYDEYALGGGVVHIDEYTCTIVSDGVQGDFREDDIADIEAQKKQAEALMQDYNSGKNPIDSKRQMEIEYDLLRHQARHELWNRIKSPDGSRK